ncbi:phosphoribosylformylglycinamidine synthase subunit PurL [Candidatus Manganitrophus noduliformans]|uniref:Phosphoribosylformylglycinamidine synthase subunit PurL n=1 Tax=Candidatus Manganitrophus noduliformans TaxID=2606439 RepID=A0A7X6DS08_9BACT|nr:phosphoribosylformylglycinamidine synthase subunit PurL [Candidatus Manganitrophus noduliformans]NKE72317.1 phosphoribosylformylglycinamidine synthase subunit PurL [Candidatus Manganitrophus noduliformans]
MTDPQKTAQNQGLPPERPAHPVTDEEYQKIVALLGREPNTTELAIFSAMWSEHCSYKSSKVHLKRFPTQGEHVLHGPGENAGVVDIGGGWVAAFKIESHNHPSFIEPYQGAATGVGGILRDIFTMGARPVALLNSLRFGPLEVPKNRYLFERVIAGIAGYGNCMGVPTVGGEIYFNEIYSKNPLVNVFCLGIAKKEEIVTAAAGGVGNPVIYVGSKTGRDGIHGATMASAELGQSEEKRHTVQVGDPFTEKLLLEACLEVMQTGCVVGIQDMGAAGLTSSSSEMAHRGGTGIEIDVSKVPSREPGMTPEEFMISESQERMLLVAKKGREAEVEAIFKKWDLDMAVIGKVTEDRLLTIKNRDEIVAQIPVSALTSEAPVYERPMATPKFQELVQSLNIESIQEPKSYSEALRTLLGSPSLASKEWVYRQYDHMVQTNTVVGPGGGDAAVIRIKGTDRALAISVDGNSTYCLLNPYYGGAIAVAEAARNLVCVGAKPIALTDCLNFGNPERPEVMWSFALCVEGMSEACDQFKIPVVSGNVSLYNETRGLGIYPTPVVGVLGLIEGMKTPLTAGFKEPNEVIVLIGETLEELGGSEYLKVLHSQERGYPPILHFEKEKGVQKVVLTAAREGILSSAHDCSEGGLAVALAESCILSPTSMGAMIALDAGTIRPDAYLFGESQSRILVSVPERSLSRLQALIAEAGVGHSVLGTTGGGSLDIRLEGKEQAIHLSVSEMKEAYSRGLAKYFD